MIEINDKENDQNKMNDKTKCWQQHREAWEMLVDVSLITNTKLPVQQQRFF